MAITFLHDDGHKELVSTVYLLTSARRSVVQGVYAIINTANGKTYIGSSCDIQERWSGHRWELKRGQHHSAILQHAWDKYGEASFVFQVMEVINDRTQLFAAEQRWIDFLQTADNNKGYNINPYAMRGGWNAKLTEEDAAEIKRRRLSGESRESIAADYGITVNTVSKIVLGRRWAHVPGAHQDGNRRNKLTESDVRAIVERLTAGESTYKIAADFNISACPVQRILDGKGWKHLNLPPIPKRRVGRQPRLSEEDVQDIRRRALTGERQCAIAKDYEIDQSTVSQIASGKRWGHLP